MSGRSTFERLVSLGRPKWQLTVQYRMHPQISAFPSATFYDAKLIDGVGAADRPPPAGFQWPGGVPFAVVDVARGSESTSSGSSPSGSSSSGGGQDSSGRRGGGGGTKRNAAEAEVVVGIVRGLLQVRERYLPCVRAEEIGVITPYRGQRDEVKSRLMSSDLSPSELDKVEVNTVDGFQVGMHACAHV